MDEQRSLLDSLMGIDRDACGKERNKRDGESFKDAKVCKYFLVGFCPNELFKNTKRELGPCPYLHNDHVLSEFEAHRDVDELTKRYERDLKGFLEDIVREADRWIDREKRNMRRPVPDINDLLTEDEKEQIEKLNAAAADLISRSEIDAEQGNFAASEQKTAHAMQAKASAEGLRERRMQAYMKREEAGAICDICGIRTEVDVAEAAAVDPGKGGYLKRPRHEEGKVHQGYIKVREKIRGIEEKERFMRAGRRGGREERPRERSPRKERDRRDRTDNDRKEERTEKKEDEDKDAKSPTEPKVPSPPDVLPEQDESEKKRTPDEQAKEKDGDDRKGESETKERSRRASREKRRSRDRHRSRDRRRSRSRRDRSRRRRSHGRRR